MPSFKGLKKEMKKRQKREDKCPGKTQTNPSEENEMKGK